RQHKARVLLDGVYGELGPSYHGSGYWIDLFKQLKLGHLMKELQLLGKEEGNPPWLIFGTKVIRPFWEELGIGPVSSPIKKALTTLAPNLSIQKAFLENHTGMLLPEIIERSTAYMRKEVSGLHRIQSNTIQRRQGIECLIWITVISDTLLHLQMFGC
ncbi:hypothetical protein, partial [Acaryochloris thomasi]